MEFASDNVFGAHETILQAMAEANDGVATSYGADDWTRRAEQELSNVFERPVKTFLVLTGSAANALALSALTPAYGGILCHKEAHINTDECGAPEFFSGGAKLVGLEGPGCKLAPATVDKALAGFVRGEHEVKPAALSISQVTELGIVYSAEEVSALSHVCKASGLKLHMDGARFANAVAALGCTPAELTWKAGVDVLCFGATKNGAMALEAVIFFDEGLAADFLYRRKKAGQLLSKGRFLGAQMLAYLKDDLWLDLARHANRCAALLADGLRRLNSVRLPLPVAANEVFAIMPRTLHERLIGEGAHYYEWPGEGPGTEHLGKDECFVRFVTSFRTDETMVGNLLKLAHRLEKSG
jgi:threonine aldolase